VTRAFEDFATGRFTKEEVLETVTRLGLRTRSGLAMNPQSFGRMLTNRLYAGLIHVPEFGVSRRGDFEPLVSEETFFRVQAVLEGRIQVTGPRKRARPDFPLKGLVRCETCGKPLTASWSKGRSGHYAYYHCWRQCRSVNVSKARLEGLFVDELKELQPTDGFMRLVKEHVLRAWEQRKAEVCQDISEIERRAKAIQQKLDRLDEAFLFAQSIDIDTYDRHKDKLRQELTLLQIDRHADQLEKFDVEGILAFAGRVLPRAADLWVQASLDQRQRLQQLFFPDGVVFDGKCFVRTGVSTHAFKYLTPDLPAENNLASPPGFEPGFQP
jgi:site-specific DNA recombinase